MLCKNPQTQQKLFYEVRDVFGSEDCKQITPEMLEKLKYTKACIKEAMRYSSANLLSVIVPIVSLDNLSTFTGNEK